MWRRWIHWGRPFGILLVASAGCVSQPAQQPEYAQIAYEAELAACFPQPEGPVTLPLEEVFAGEHPVDFYVVSALERNPDLLAATHRVTAQAERIPQVTALDDPMVSEQFYPFEDNSLQTAGGRLPSTLTLSQKFPRLSKLRVRGEVEEQETKIALTQVAQTQLRVTEQVKLAYYDLYANQQAIEITESSRELLEDLLKFAEARYRTGGSQQDVLRAQLELDRIQDQLIQLERMLRVSQADMAELLHTSPETEPLADKKVDLEDVPEAIDLLYEAAVRCRPELQERLHAIVRDQRKRELARLQYYPDFNVGLGWQAVTTDNALARNANGNDNFLVTVGFNLPIWQDKLRAGVREAESRVLADARSYDAERDDTFRQIRRLIAQADAFEQQIELFTENIIPRAEQTLQVSVADYRVGKVDFLQIIDNWNELLRFEIQLARLRANLGQTLASLELVVGCQLATLPELVTPEPAPVPNAPPPALEDGEQPAQPDPAQEKSEKKKPDDEKQELIRLFPTEAEFFPADKNRY